MFCEGTRTKSRCCSENDQPLGLKQKKKKKKRTIFSVRSDIQKWFGDAGGGGNFFFFFGLLTF